MKTAAQKIKAAQYLKIVEWSEADKCFIGRCPGLFNGGIHGDEEARVYQELCNVAEEWITILEDSKKPLPEPTAGKTYSGKFAVRVAPALHQRAALKAASRGESLNQFVSHALAKA